MKQALTVFFRYIEPVFVLALFVAIPIARPAPEFAFPDPSQAVFLGISGIWLWSSRRLFDRRSSVLNPQSSILNPLTALAAFASLCAFAAVFSALGSLAGKAGVPRFDRASLAPARLAVIAVAAFFEEILFRAYLPSKLSAFFPRKLSDRHAAEILSVLLFAASHIHAGVFSALNALFAGTILQICFAKTKSVALTGSVHAAYNIAVLVFLARFGRWALP